MLETLRKLSQAVMFLSLLQSAATLQPKLQGSSHSGVRLLSLEAPPCSVMLKSCVFFLEKAEGPLVGLDCLFVVEVCPGGIGLYFSVQYERSLLSVCKIQGRCQKRQDSACSWRPYHASVRRHKSQMSSADRSTQRINRADLMTTLREPLI